MLKKYLIGFVIFSSVLVAVPVLATTSTDDGTNKLTAEERILEAQKKLLERYEAAKSKLQEKLTALQKRQQNLAAATACVGLAVNNRESSIASAFTQYSKDQQAALSARATALSAAWSAPSSTQSQLKLAVNKAWSDYKTAHRNAVVTHNSSTKAAWNLFRTAARTCKATQSGVVVDSRASGLDVAQ